MLKLIERVSKLNRKIRDLASDVPIIQRALFTENIWEFF